MCIENYSWFYNEIFYASINNNLYFLKGIIFNNLKNIKNPIKRLQIPLYKIPNYKIKNNKFTKTD